jgi:hypothetical protein
MKKKKTHVSDKYFVLYFQGSKTFALLFYLLLAGLIPES